MVRGLSRDTLEYDRQGRVVGEEHYREAIRARARELLKIDSAGGKSSGGTGAVGRASAAAAPGTRGMSNETVLKVISWTKSRNAPLAQAKYAARTREQDPPEAAIAMVNEEGRALRGAEVEAEIRSWGLRPDSENLSPAARQANAQERAAMPVGERLQRRQAAHLIFSMPAHAKADTDRLERAVERGLAETFGKGGFRYVYAIHTDQSARPHAHIIVKARSDAIDAAKSRQLRLGPRELDAVRHVLTRHAQEQGLKVIATRREDRAELRDEILSGKAPLRANEKLHQAGRRTRQGEAFRHQAPEWYRVHGLDYERRRAVSIGQPTGVNNSVVANDSPQERRGGLLTRFLGRLVGREPSSAASPSDAPAKMRANQRRAGYFQNFENYRKDVDARKARILEHFAATHLDPSAAVDRFRDLVREAPRLALWAANHHPIAFGEVTGAHGTGLSRRDLGQHASGGRREPMPSTHQDLLVAGAQASLRETAAQRRIESRQAIAATKVRRSLVGVADRLERGSAFDLELGERATEVRNIVSGPEPGSSRSAEQRSRNDAARREPSPSDRTRRYEELKKQVRRRDEARRRNRPRGRDDSGRDR